MHAATKFKASMHKVRAGVALQQLLVSGCCAAWDRRKRKDCQHGLFDSIDCEDESMVVSVCQETKQLSHQQQDCYFCVPEIHAHAKLTCKIF